MHVNKSAFLSHDPMDLEGAKQELIEREFLAVILAGFGNK